MAKENQSKEKISNKQRIIVGIAAVGSFIGCLYFFLNLFDIYEVGSTEATILSIVAALIVVWIILTLSGLLKEFTLKGGGLELSATLHEEMKNVQSDMKETRKDFSDKYERLIQHINTRIDNVVSNANANVNQINIGDIVESVTKLIREQKIEKLSTAGIGEQMDLRNTVELSDDIKRYINELNKQEEKLTKLLERLPSRNIPIDKTSSLVEANYYYTEGNFNKSLEMLNEILENYPNYGSAWNSKGIILRAMERDSEAVECFEKAVRLDPSNHILLRNLSVSLRKIGRMDDALESVEKALKLNPKYPIGWLSKGFTLEKVGRTQEAQECYNKVLEFTPNTFDEWDDRGFALLRLNRLNEAQESLEKALKLNPNHAATNYDLAMLYAVKNDVNKSITHLSIAITRYPRYKSEAKNESFFETIKNEPRFKKLVE